MINFFDLLGRVFISALFLVSAYNKIFNIEGSMEWMENLNVPGLLIYPAILLEIILPIFIILGYKVRFAASILSLFCISTAFLFHFDFSNQSEVISFLKNIGLAGGFLFIVVNGAKDWSVTKNKKYVRL